SKLSAYAATNPAQTIAIISGKSGRNRYSRFLLGQINQPAAAMNTAPQNAAISPTTETAPLVPGATRRIVDTSTGCPGISPPISVAQVSAFTAASAARYRRTACRVL